MPILPAADARFEFTLPVLVVGAGACGLTAALAASDAGAEVLVLERDARPTGSTSLSAGLIPAAGTRFQRERGIDDSPDLFAADLIRKAKGQNDAVVAAAVAEASGPTVDWLAETHEVGFQLLEGFTYPGHSRLRMHGPASQTGADLEVMLLGAVERAGIDVMTNASVEDVYADAEGRVAGVGVRRPDGARETIGCRTLVLACNGFGGNPALVRAHIPEMADAEYCGHTSNTGDALAWGLGLGAAAADLTSYQGHGSVPHPHAAPITWAVITLGGFQVNARGRRFANEMLGYSEHAEEVLRQPGRFAWDIYDARCEAAALGFHDYREINRLGAIKHANTIEELAAVTGLPLDALAQTTAEAEQCAAGSAEDPFGRDFAASPSLSSPYRAARITGALFHTQGGLVVDGAARVLRADGSALPNLFAAGGAARGLSGPAAWGYLSGNGLLSATVLGRLAGLSAAAVVSGRPSLGNGSPTACPGT